MINYKNVLYCFALALMGCLLSMGTVLTYKYTIAQTAYTDTVTRHDECRFEGPAWNCVKPHQKVPGADPGATAWVDFPAAYFFKKQGQQSTWNPYVGSGYPMFMDGMSREITPSRKFVKAFPSEQGRDVLIFLRFLIWSWALVGLVYVMGVRGPILYVSGFFATLIPAAAELSDAVYLDSDMLAPIIFLWLYWGSLQLKSKKHSLLFYFFGLILGVWSGAQAFFQAVIIGGIIVGFASLFFLPKTKMRGVWGLVCYSLGYLSLSVPQLLNYLDYFPQFSSNREVIGACLSLGIGTKLFIEGSLQSGYLRDSYFLTFFTIGGLTLLAWKGWKSKAKTFFFLYLFLCYLVVFGFPEFICQFKQFRNLAFNRHTVLYIQCLFFICIVVASFEWAQVSLRWKKTKTFFLILLVISPFCRYRVVSVNHLKGKYAQSAQMDYSQIPAHVVYSEIQRLSQKEDRRHFAPDYRLFPNFSAAFEILDLRSLYGLFPNSIFILNDQLYKKWMGDTSSSGRADRFVGPFQTETIIDEDLQRVLAMNRVSLLTFSKDKMWLLPEGAYSQKNCKKLSQDVVAQSWLCPWMSGVAYFPEKVIFAANDEALLHEIKKVPVMQLAKMAFVSDQNLTPGAGSILEFKRTAERMTYQVKVTKPGLFIFADTWFSGWKAEINGQEAPLYRVNVAFKGVMLPMGENTVEFIFKPTVRGF